MRFSSGLHRLTVLCTLSASPLPFLMSPAFAAGALPTGGNFVAGSGSIAQSTNALTVNQSTQRGIINWGSFSIGQGNSVAIKNGAGATLNRVTGNSLSTISGSLTSTGSTYLINQNGVIVTPTGSVVTGGSFVASTRDTDNAAFVKGQAAQFNGNSTGTVTNQGTIKVANGDAVLIGKSVTNSGTVSAPNGTAALVAGDDVLIQPSGSGLQIKVNTGSGDVTNSGTVEAAQAALNAVGGNVYALSGNNGGLVRATGTATVNGHVWLTAGGKTNVAGKVAAQNADGSGGAITVSGGSAAVSGTLDASATSATGSGGAVSVTSTGATDVSGTLLARPGPQGGNGGSIETSGTQLSVGGATVNAGQGGQWLLDPYDLSVDQPAATTINSSLGSGTSVTLQTTATGTSGPGTPNASGNGDIFINSALSWGTTATLNISAYRNIDINANVTVSGGGTLSLTTGTGTTGDYIIAAGSSISYTGGSGVGAHLSINGTSYTLLYSMTDVQNINNMLGGKYALATSLDASAVLNWIPIGTDGTGNILNSGSGFGGTFTGLGNTISNLSVNLPSVNNVGLFGFSSGAIRDIDLVGGSINGSSGVGEIVGFNHSGTITNAFATGVVSGSGYEAGGLVGSNQGVLSNAYAAVAVNGGAYAGGLVGGNDGTINNAYATGAVSGFGYGFGGLVGFNYLGAITNAYATGAVNVPGGSYVGGLTGINESTINNSYATGTVGGGSEVGGLVGRNFGGTITQSYATGATTGSTNFGGLIGFNSGAVSSSFWDKTTTGQASSAGGTGLTSAQFFTASSFTGFTFGTTPGASGWVIVDSNGTFNNAGGAAGNTRPILLSEYSTSIVNVHQLQLMELKLSATYTLGSNVDASATAGSNPSDLWTSAGFVPIGTSSPQFMGTLDGQGHTINQLTINRPSTTYVGLLGYLGSAGTVQNLGLIAGSITGANRVGGLVGESDGTIIQTYVTGAVSGGVNSQYIGGLVGLNNSNIGSSYTTGAVSAGTGADYIGGLVGDLYRGSITGSYATGGVTAGSGSTSIGGLAGYVSIASITGSYATGAVTAPSSNYVGGLVGLNYAGSVSQSHATGAVHADDNSTYVGGLVGLEGDEIGGTSSITQSYATGAVTTGDSSLYAGGLVGDEYNGTVTQSYATGAVTAGSSSKSIGGLTGFISGGFVSGSYASGAVTSGTSSQDIGGLSGSNYSGTISQSFATGAVNVGSNSSEVGGLVGLEGYVGGGGITQSYATGAVTAADATNHVGGLVGDLNAGSFSQNYATGTVSVGNNSTNTGALAGISYVPVTQSYATGAVTAGGGANAIGGLVGLNEGSIVSSYATGPVTVGAGAASVYIGGLVGNNDGGSIAQSHATGAVSAPAGATAVGGLAGLNENASTITQSYATGAVSAGDSAKEVGGLVGNNIYSVSTITQSYATGTVTAGINATSIGGLVGTNDSAAISKSYATGSVTTGDGATQVGGLVGDSLAPAGFGGTITQSYATGAVTTGNSSQQVGGLVGTVVYSGSSVTQSYALGAVTTGTNSKYVGGLAGLVDTSGANQTYATGAVTAGTGSTLVGGLIGGTISGSATSSYWDTTTTGQATSAGGAGAKGLTTAQFFTTSNFTGFTFGTTPGATGWVIVDADGTFNNAGGAVGNTRPILLSEYSTNIVNLHQLQLTTLNLSANYTLGANIDASGTNAASHPSDLWTGAGFVPIGNNITKFTGVLDGQGHTISGLYINRPTTDYVGLFGYVGSAGAVENVGLPGNSTTGYNMVGGLVGQNDGSIAQSYTTGAVTGSQYDAGGLVGLNGGAISQSYATGTISGANQVGGLVGQNTGTISTSYATSSVNASAPDDGGLVGYNYNGAIAQSYATGAVSGSNFVGGLVGANNQGAVTQSYATGAATGSSSIVGGLVGYNNNNITQSYATGSANGFSQVGGLVGQNFGTVTQSHATGAVSGSYYIGGLVGDNEGGPISDAYAVGAVNASSYGAGGLVGYNSGTMSNVYATGNAGGTLYDIGGLIGYNNGSINNAYATGAVTGKTGSNDVGGLVGENRNSGDINGVYATGTVSGTGYVGGLIGYNANSGTSTITSSYATGNVTGSTDVGGLLGYNNAPGAISSSHATGTVSGTDSVGGLVGYNYSGTISNTYATGAVNAGGTVGGLVGYNSGSVTQSYSKGVVTGQGTSNYVGGLVGENVNSGTIDSDYAQGAVSGTGYVGGLVGYNFNSGTITRSYATGTVTGINYVGGLLGYNNAAGVVSSDYATGAVSGSDFVGGLVGINDASIFGSFATGMVRGGINTGGLVGTNDVTVTSSYWDIGTSGQRTSAGGTGTTTAQLQSASLPAGFDGSVWSTLGGESYPYLKWQFPVGTPQVVSGLVHDADGSTPLGGATVATYFGGVPLNSVLTGGATTTGANGYYYYLLAPGTLPASTSNAIGATATPAGSANVAGLSFSTSNGAWFIGRNPDGSATGINTTSDLIFARTSDSTYSALGVDLNTTFGASNYAALSATLSGANLAVQSTSVFSVDQAISRSGTIKIETGADLTITPSGSLASSATGDAIVLAANGNVQNNAGASALNASNATGRWLIYSQATGTAGQAPPSDNFGGLTAKNYYGDLFSFGAGDPGTFASEPGPGNRFVYGYQPVLTVTPDTKSLAYNGVSQADSYTISGLINGDQASDGYVGAAALSPAPRNAGRYNVTAVLGSLSSPDNYAFNFGSGTLTINPAALTISAVSDSKVYNGTTDSSGIPTTTGTLYGTDGVSDLSQAFASKDVKGTNGSTLSVSAYTVNDGNSGANYIVTTPTASGTITPAPLSISAVTDSKVYNGTTASGASPTVGTLYSTDTVTGLTQAFDSRHVLGLNGSTLLITGYKVNDGNNGNDYTVTTYTAMGTITAASLDITAVTDSRQYDGTTNSSGTPMFGTLYSTDTVTGLSQAFTSKDVLGLNGSTLSVTGYTVNDGNSGHDYTVTTHTALGTITAAPLDISAVSDSRQYNGTTSSTGTPTVGTLYGDTVTGLSQAFTSKDVNGAGLSTLAVTGYTVNDGNGGADYAVTTHTASGTITAAPLDISAVSDARQYDGTTTSSGAPTVGTLYSTDSVSGLSQGFTSKDVKGTGLSTLEVTGYTVNDGNGGADYAVTTHTASGTITAAPLDISAVSDARQYDGTTTSTATPTVGTLYSTDSVTGLSQAFTSKDVKGAGLSTLAVTGYTVNDGNGGADYAVTTHTASGTITPAPLDITAVTDSRQYNGTTNSTGTPTVGTLYGDTVTSLSQAFTSKDVKGAGLSTLLVTGYAVNDGVGGADYAVTTHTTSGTITPAPLDITAVTDSRQYNGTTASSGTPTVTGTRYGTDNVTGLMQAFALKDVKGAGHSTLLVTGYAVNDGVGGADYAVTTHSAFGTITPAPLTITATTQTKTYDGTTNSTSIDPYTGAVLGSVLPAITSGIVYDPYTLPEVYASRNAGAAGAAILVPSISINDGNAGADYSVTPQNANGTINVRPLLLSGNRTYDGTTNAAASILNMVNLVAGDHVTLSGTGTLTGNGISNANPTPGFASRGTLAVSGSDAGNYTLGGITTPVLVNGHLQNTVSISLTGVNFGNVNFSGQNLAGLNFTGATLTGANFSGASLIGAIFTNASLSNANFSNSNLMNADFAGAYLKRANLSNSNLANSNLSNADLTNANVSNANLTGANLTGATWTNGQVCKAGSIGMCN